MNSLSRRKFLKITGAAVGAAAAFEKMKEVSKFFGGTPQDGAAEQPTAVIAMPKLMMPSGPAGSTPPGSTPKKKKEGC